MNPVYLNGIKMCFNRAHRLKEHSESHYTSISYNITFHNYTFESDIRMICKSTHLSNSAKIYKITSSNGELYSYLFITRSIWEVYIFVIGFWLYRQN